tara:strand:- start:168 stop:836 length:669 start_codon:yes stop_codon:yes gene_type:complete
MNENTQNIFEITSTQLTPIQIIINLAVCIICTLILNFVYKIFSKTATNKLLFIKVFPIYSIAIFLIITVIQSSIALSLGLVGALSIIRFRTAIKEPEQLIYLLMCTGIGIGAAANQLEAVLIGTALFSFLSFLMNRKYNNDNKSVELHNGQILIIETKKYIPVDKLLKKLKLISGSNPNLLSFDSTFELNIYSISISGEESVLIDFLKTNFPNTNISFAKQK